MSNTRLKALLKQIDSGRLKSDSSKVLSFIILNEITTRPFLSLSLNMPEKTVSARVSDLLDMGIIYVLPFNPSVDNKDKFEFLAYESNPIKQSRNAYERKKKKFELWKKRGLNEFSEFIYKNQIELEL